MYLLKFPNDLILIGIFVSYSRSGKRKEQILLVSLFDKKWYLGTWVHLFLFKCFPRRYQILNKLKSHDLFKYLSTPSNTLISFVNMLATNDLSLSSTCTLKFILNRIFYRFTLYSLQIAPFSPLCFMWGLHIEKAGLHAIENCSIRIISLPSTRCKCFIRWGHSRIYNTKVKILWRKF